MKSNDKLKKEVKQLRKEGSDNYRVKQIKNLRQQLRETQSIADALTKTLMNKTGMAKEEMGELYDEILSQPKLSKPNNPVKLKKEVLVAQNQNAALERELANTKRLLREYRSGERRAEDDEGRELPHPSKRLIPAPSDSALAENLRQLKLAHDISLGEIETKTRVISLHREMVEKLQAENRELRQMKQKWDLLHEAKTAAEEDAARARHELVRHAGSNEDSAQDIRELRLKLQALMQVREKIESQHAQKVAQLHTNIQKIQERESHLLGQINLLKADLKTSTDSVAWYRQQAALAKSAAGPNATDSEKVWELQTKLAIVTKELKETKLELRGAGGAHSKKGEAERALHDRISQLQSDNARLSSQMDVIERKYLTFHEDSAATTSQMSDLQSKYHAALQELDQRHTRSTGKDNAMQELLNRRNQEMEGRLQQMQATLERMQQEQREDRTEVEKGEKIIAQLRTALADASNNRSYTGQGGGGGDSTSRSQADSSDDLLGRAHSHSSHAAASAAQKALRKAEEAHLEQVAKLMRQFETKEKEMLYQIARLQEQIKPGSGNRTHLNYKSPYQTKAAVMQQQQRPTMVGGRKPINLDSSDEDEEDDDDDLEL